jgi:hypothetical protein
LKAAFCSPNQLAEEEIGVARERGDRLLMEQAHVADARVPGRMGDRPPQRPGGLPSDMSCIGRLAAFMPEGALGGGAAGGAAYAPQIAKGQRRRPAQPQTGVGRLYRPGI